MVGGLLLVAVLAGGVAAASSSLSSAGTSSSVAGASVVVNATVVPVRLIVVDEASVIREVWSNASGSEYTLQVRLGSRSGPDLPATDEVMAQYVSLASGIDWSVRGLAYVNQT